MTLTPYEIAELQEIVTSSEWQEYWGEISTRLNTPVALSTYLCTLGHWIASGVELSKCPVCEAGVNRTGPQHPRSTFEIYPVLERYAQWRERWRSQQKRRHNANLHAL